MSSPSETPMVAVFLRHRGAVLLLRRSDEADSYAGRWGAVTAPVSDGDLPETARSAVEKVTGLQDHNLTLVREGPSVTVTDKDRGTERVVHPFLFDTETREISTSWETDTAEWTSPTALLRRKTIPAAWTAYRRVAPSIIDLTDDTTHGSSTLSVRALEILRDRAGLLATTDTADIEDARARLADVTQRLLDARPAMAALANRIHRVLHESRPDPTPETVETRAHAAISRALDAGGAAAERAASLVDDRHVLTLSRSGTVMAALRKAEPASVTVAVSQPGGEGIAVAEALADDDMDVALCPDAAVTPALADTSVDLVLVGADTLFPSGAVVNKVGTRAAALAACREEIPFYATCSVDKTAVEAAPPTEVADRRSVYDGPAALSVLAPRFDVTPPALVTGGLATERGVLSPDEMGSVANEMQRFRGSP